MAMYHEGLDKHELARLEEAYRTGRVLAQPDRITCALDLRGMDGPDVDRHCLAAEPDVDEWEAGRAAPSWEQLLALADLTGFSPRFFTESPPNKHVSRLIVCQRSGKGKGCHVVEPRSSVPPYDPSEPLARVINLFGQQVIQ